MITNAERLKTLYALGKLTLEAFMDQIDAQLAAGTLDDAPPDPRSPEAAAAKWRTTAAASAERWANQARFDAAIGSLLRDSDSRAT